MGGAVVVTPPLSSAVGSTVVASVGLNATSVVVQPTTASSVISTTPAPSIIAISPCSPAYCFNGGVCSDTKGYAECYCQPGFYGNRCDAAALSYVLNIRITASAFGSRSLQNDASYYSINLINGQSSLAVAMTEFLSSVTQNALWSEKSFVRTIIRQYRVSSSEISVEQVIEFKQDFDNNGAAVRLSNLYKAHIGNGSLASTSSGLTIDVDTTSVQAADYNECVAPAAGYCDANAACTNTLGGYTCKCNSGYKGSGFVCAIDNDAIKEEELKTIYIWGGIVGVVLVWMITLACCMHRRKIKRIKKAKKRDIIEEEVGQEAGIYHNSKGNLLHEKNANSLGIITEGKRHSFSSEGSFDQRSSSSPSLSDARRQVPGLHRHGDRRPSSGYFSDNGGYHPSGGRSSAQSGLQVPHDNRRNNRMSVEEQRRFSSSQIPDGRNANSLGRDGGGPRRHSSNQMPGRRESSQSASNMHHHLGHRRSNSSNGMTSIDEQRRLSHGYDPRKDSTSSSGGSRPYGSHLDVPRGRGPKRPSSQPEMPQSRKSLGDIHEDRPASSHSLGGHSSGRGSHQLYPPSRERRHTVSHMNDYDSEPDYGRPAAPSSMTSLNIYGSQPDFMGRMHHSMSGMQPLNVDNLRDSPVPRPDYE